MSTEQTIVRQYGNIAEDRTAGLMGFSMASTVVLGAGAIGVFIAIMASQIWVAVGIALVAFLAATILGSKDRHGRSKPERWLARSMHAKAKKAGRRSTRQVLFRRSRTVRSGRRACWPRPS